MPASGGDKKAHPDIEEGERECFGRSAQISKLASLGQKEPVEKHFKHENGEQNSNLQRQISTRRPMCGPLEPVPPLKFVPLHLQVAQMPPQPVQLVAALRGFGAELGDRRRRRLPDGAETAFEVETRQSLLVGAKLVEKQPVGGILLGLRTLEDPAFDVIEGDAVGSRLFAGASLRAGRSKSHIARELVDVERREDLQRRPIIVLLAPEPVQQAREGGSW